MVQSEAAPPGILWTLSYVLGLLGREGAWLAPGSCGVSKGPGVPCFPARLEDPGLGFSLQRPQPLGPCRTLTHGHFAPLEAGCTLFSRVSLPTAAASCLAG